MGLKQSSNRKRNHEDKSEVTNVVEEPGRVLIVETDASGSGIEKRTRETSRKRLRMNEPLKNTSTLHPNKSSSDIQNPTRHQRRSRKRLSSAGEGSDSDCKVPREQENSNTATTIPRSLSLPLLDEFSMLFSDYFARHVKTDPAYMELSRVNWNRRGSHEPLPLLPPHLTPDMVFRTNVQQATKNILIDWESGDQKTLTDQFLRELFVTSIFGQVYDRLMSRQEDEITRSDYGVAFRQVWFGQYSWNQMRADSNSTCGFQHVFIGENSRGVIKGLHHWGRLYILEKSARLVVHEVIKKDPHLPIAALQFSVDQVVKRYGTLFFGIHIELEILIFFCAFLLGGSRDVHLLIDGNPVTVVCYDVATRNDVLATAYFKY